MNLATNLERSALFFPTRPAVRDGDIELTYGELNDRANRVATGLIATGVKPGDLIAICAPNSADWPTFYFGILKAGAAAVTLYNTATKDELSGLLSHSKPRVLFTTENRVPDVEHLRGQDMLDTVICETGTEMDLERLMKMGTGSFRAINREPTDTAAVLYTGGTTGVPKGVMLMHQGIDFSSQAVAYFERSTENDFALCFLPFNHVFGQVHIMNSTILSAGCLEVLPGFDMDKVLALLEAGRVTKFFSVPTVFVRLLSLPDLRKKLGKMRYCFSAGASMATEIVKQWKETTGITISEGYGMTEAMPVTYNHFYPEKHVVGSIGGGVHRLELEIRFKSKNAILKASVIVHFILSPEINVRTAVLPKLFSKDVV
jgi:long-chain acyl-CoA synthetase